ncbi:MAG: proC [Rhodospirillales bacterium]|nr:proC [Rhodospirillales bacterium]
MTQVLLIGCGRMGGSLLKGWRESGVVDRAIVVDPAMPFLPGTTIVASLSDVAGPLPKTILLAVKPQMLDQVLPGLKERLPDGALVISIAAGKTLAYFADRLGPSAAVVRTMPNTPAAIGRGITVCCANGTVGAQQRETTDRLLAAVGQVAWTEDESLMHAVTAVSGSGPAYVFLLIEALQAAGEASGLPPDLAAQLARQTVAGSGELARRSPDDPAKLRADVTSPAGTTAAALTVLMAEDGLLALMKRAVAAATARSEELAKG